MKLQRSIMGVVCVVEIGVMRWVRRRDRGDDEGVRVEGGGFGGEGWVCWTSFWASSSAARSIFCYCLVDLFSP